MKSAKAKIFKDLDWETLETQLNDFLATIKEIYYVIVDRDSLKRVTAILIIYKD